MFQVRQVCTDLLQQYPSMEFVSITLATLSQLAAKSLMDLPEQVGRLICCLPQTSSGSCL